MGTSVNCSGCRKSIELTDKQLNSAVFITVICPYCGESCPLNYDDEREEYSLWREDDV